ncbi:MAG: xanthine dehydrogenase small subunit [Gammaproteobacteria bacterium]|nr:xanthine dehydrogenase small subunit [Gammaproteobacteria bacterium]MDH4255993.1 xanthine dehydrogenase small subunit [Gammaproteobacteria bacterium]MDH5309246.1 xanthine dehydrogenase small subunit [Gammaproteobacteria bacterium]
MAAVDTTAEGAGTVRFVLDGEIVELHDVDPNRTLLQWLRDDLRRTGTKEGCAEGDCGACTVVVGELDRDDSTIRLRAVNSCIRFLATLDGKELITVESLRDADGSLHPVQQALVENHGSQCGFCTPGFVMSLLALFKNADRPGRIEIDDALAGNLCRCTGYRPIVAAATRMYQLADPADADWLRRPGRPGEAPPADRLERLRSIAREQATCVGSGDHRLYAPRDAGELATLLAAHPSALLLAGGTDAALQVTKQLREFETIIYTGNVAELLCIENGPDGIEIGAAVTLADAVPVIVGHYPELEELFLRFASPPIRNAATLGGNVANASPIGDSMPALLVLDCELSLQGAAGTRVLPLAEFYLGYRKTALQPGEFLRSIRIPARSAGDLVKSYKVSKRFDQDISAVCGAFRLRFSGDRVTEARVAYGGMAATPARALDCESALAGAVFDEAAVEQAMQALARDYEPISDMRASAAYRMRIAANLLRRLYLEYSGNAAVGVYAHGRG